MKRLPFVALSILVIAGLSGCTPAETSSTAATSTDDSTEVSTTVEVSSEDVSSEEESSEEALEYTGTEVEGATKLTMWAAQEDLDAMGEMQAAYNEANPTEKIWISGAAIGEKDVGGKYAGDPDNVPDIAHVPGDAVNDMITNGYISAFTDISQDLIDDDFPGESAAILSDEDDNIYALPFSLNTFFMYYNMSVFDEADLTSLDTMKAAVADKEATDGETYTTMSIPDGGGWQSQSFFMSNGDGIFTEDGTNANETYLNGTAALNTVKLFQDLTNSGDFVMWDEDAGKAAIAAGTCQSMVTGSWNYGIFEKAWGAENVGMTTMPSIKIGGETKEWRSIGDYKSIVVSNNSTQKALAKKFSYFMASAEGQKIRFENNGGGTVPTSAELNAEADFIAVNKFAGVVSDLLASNLFNQNKNDNFGNWWNAWDAFKTSLDSGIATATEEEMKDWLATFDDALTKSAA